MEAVDELASRRLSAWYSYRKKVEVEYVQSLLDKCKIGAARFAFDAEFAQRLKIGRRDDFTTRIARKVFDREFLPFGVAQGAIAKGPASGGEQLARLAQVAAKARGRVRGRW